MPLEPPNLEPSDEDGPGAHEAWRLRQLELHRDMGSARVGGARVEVDPGTSEQSWMLGMIWKKNDESCTFFGLRGIYSIGRNEFNSACLALVFKWHVFGH